MNEWNQWTMLWIWFCLTLQGMTRHVKTFEGPLWKVCFIKTYNICIILSIFITHSFCIVYSVLFTLSVFSYLFFRIYLYILLHIYSVIIHLSLLLKFMYLFLLYFVFIFYFFLSFLCLFDLLLQSSRFFGWRSYWVVLQDGVLSWYPKQWVYLLIFLDL